MGIKFHLAPAQKKALDEIIQRDGYTPTTYLRKYPRIPSDQTIQTFPLKAYILPVVSKGKFGDPMIAEVGNISPSGALLSSDSSHAIEINPTNMVRVIFEPRGWFPHKVMLDAQVCRISDEMSPQEGGNLRRYFGLKFARIDDDNKRNFLDLMKDILERIKAKKG
jgi:hypothetical protein